MKDQVFLPGLLTSVVTLAMITACGSGEKRSTESFSQTLGAGDIELARETERLLIADGQDPIVRVFDVAEKKTVSNFPLSGKASVYTGPSSRFAYAVQSATNQISIVDGSLVFEDHGDHQHYDKFDPVLLDQPLYGENPIHFLSHEGYVAAFFDNEGRALMMEEGSLLQAERKMVQIKTAMPHHGVALAWADSFLVTRPELLPGSPRATPVGVDVYGHNGEPTGETFGPCVSLHGEAIRSDAVVFGCDDGVLVLRSASSGLSSTKLMNPAGPDATKRRVGTLVAHEKAPYFVGNFGANLYAEIDVEMGTFIYRNAPLDYTQFTFSADGSQLLFLGKNGELAVLDTNSRVVLHQSKVTSAATGVDYGARDPKMAVGKKFVYITNPGSGELVVFSLATLQEVGRFPVEGEPTKLTIMDFPGRT